MSNTLFDEAVLLLGRRQSVDDLVDVLGAEDREPVRVGIVLAVPIVIAGLDEWSRDPVHASWLSDRLDDLDRSGIDPNQLITERHDVDEVGGAMLDTVLGPRRPATGERIGERAGLPVATADWLLSAAATAVLELLGGRRDGLAGAESVSTVLASERQHLIDAGWQPWLDQNTELDDEPERAVDPVGAPPIWPEPQIASAAVVASGSTLQKAPVEPKQRFAPVETETPQQERSKVSRLVRPGTLVLAGLLVVAALLFAFSFTQLGSDEESDLAQATETAAGPTTSVPAGDTQDSAVDPAAPSAAVDGTVAAASDAEVVEVNVRLDDPLELTPDTGSALLILNRTTGEICFEFGVDGIGNPYDGHIHSGPAGVKGGIVVDFGELVDSPTGCIDNRPVDTNAILDDLSGHYAEFHHPGGVNTVRAQLAAREPTTETVAAEDAGDGAVVVIEAGAVVLRGDVPDQVTIDKLMETFADIDLGSSEVVDELTIVAGAPRPSGLIIVDNSILFAHDSDELADPDSEVLVNLATIFSARPAWTMTVVGHTDSVGTDVYNLELSLQRAAAVRDALVDAGVDPEALAIEGAGATDPAATNETPGGRARNRRIEFHVVAA